MASNDAVERIKERLSIVDVVAPYVELHPAGKSMKGKSPFTSERTPSFFVSPDRGMFYCFSTSQGGDMFTFVEKMEGVDFKGALKILADKAGVELVPEDPKKRSERDLLYVALEEATKLYEQEIKQSSGSLEYLKRRGVSDATKAKWRIGFAPDEWRTAVHHLKQKGIGEALARKAGLAKGDEGKEPYDVFRGRVMFPICDASGRVVGFSGRILAKDTDAPKYVNSPETELFNKSDILFGYDKAKQSIRSMDFSLIVEGQFDVVMSHQAGYTNTVAVSGTALTPDHVGLLQRLSNRVVLALDGDKAGVAAVKRGAELMLRRGMDVKVATLPDNQDPADLVLSDPAIFKHAIGNAKHVIEFLIAHIQQHTKDERKFKLRVRDEVLPFVAHIESAIDREHFEGVVAEATETTREAVHLEVERLRALSEKEEDAEPIVSELVAVKEPSAVSLDRATRLGAYLVAAHAVVPKQLAAVLERVVKSITTQEFSAYAASIPAEVLNPLEFSLEEDLGAKDIKKQAAALASSIEDWRQVITKVRGQTLRAELARAAGNEEQIQILLRQIQQNDEVRHAPATTAADLLEAA